MTKIIAISGISGAGKSTLVRKLAEYYSASYICWDDFDAISAYPSDYVRWYHDSRDYSAWDYPELSETLRNLKNKQMVLHPVTQKIILPTPLIFFDSPLGKLHQQTGKWIDLFYHIRLPLDVALCRRLIRDYQGKTGSVTEIIDEMRFYLSECRELFDDTLLIEKADLVLDGILPVRQLVSVIDEHLHKNGLASDKRS